MNPGDIVVIHSKWLERDRGVDWLICMDDLEGLVGIVTQIYTDRILREQEPSVTCVRVKTYHAAEGIGPSEVHLGFIYYVDCLRPATEDEKQAFQLVHLMRKDDNTLR